MKAIEINLTDYQDIQIESIELATLIPNQNQQVQEDSM